MVVRGKSKLSINIYNNFRHTLSYTSRNTQSYSIVEMPTMKVSFAFCCRRQLCELRNHESNVLEHEIGATDEAVSGANDGESIDVDGAHDDEYTIRIGNQQPDR